MGLINFLQVNMKQRDNHIPQSRRVDTKEINVPESKKVDDKEIYNLGSKQVDQRPQDGQSR